MAMEVKDIIIDDSNDIIVNSTKGDFEISFSDQQHIVLIINTYLGHWKQFPFVGVGIKRYLNSSGQQGVIKRNTSVQLQGDGYQDDAVVLKGNSIYYVDAKRIR